MNKRISANVNDAQRRRLPSNNDDGRKEAISPVTSSRRMRMAKRRGRNEGSIYQRKDGRWVGAVHVGHKGGQRLRKHYYGATRQEVAKKLTVALSRPIRTAFLSFPSVRQ